MQNIMSDELHNEPEAAEEAAEVAEESANAEELA